MPVQSLYEIIHWNATIIDATTPTIADVKPQGIITELELPKLVREVDTTKRAGESGTVPRLKFWTDMEMSFNCKATFKEMSTALAKMSHISGTVKLTACLTDDANVTTAYIVECKGFITEFDVGKFSDNGYEATYKMAVYYLKATLGTFILISDPRNYIFSINGTNLLANIKDTIDPPVVP